MRVRGFSWSIPLISRCSFVHRSARLSRESHMQRCSPPVGDTRRKLLTTIMTERRERRRAGEREREREREREGEREREKRNDSPFSSVDSFATITFDGMKVENAVGVFQTREERRDKTRAPFVINRDFNETACIRASYPRSVYESELRLLTCDFPPNEISAIFIIAPCPFHSENDVS